MKYVLYFLATFLGLIAKILIDRKLGLYEKNRVFYFLTVAAVAFMVIILYKNKQ